MNRSTLLVLSIGAALAAAPFGLAQNSNASTHAPSTPVTGVGNGAASPSSNVAATAANSTAGNATANAAAAAGGNGNGNGNGSAAQPAAHTPNPKASGYSTAVQSILQKFDTSRDQLVAQRQALLDQLAAAKTDAERKTIQDELRNEQQTMQDQQRATAKEIRAELQAMRRQRSGGS